MRQDHRYLVRADESTQEVVVEAVQQVTNAIDGSLPTYVDQGRSGCASCAVVIRGITFTRFIVRGHMQVH
jgi:CRISPR/Cas system-associated exonuclease Cas4 (RecB family)